jgi:membrane-associated HD superfamily phosphohydrolase
MRRTIITAFLLAMPALALAEPPEHPPPPAHPQGEGPDKLLERVKDKWPEKYKHLTELRQSNPRLFHQSMMKLRHQLLKGEQDPLIMERMGEMRDLRKAFNEKVDAYSTADAKAKVKIREEMVKLATKMFNARQAARKRRLDRAKERIIELETEIKDRDAKQAELIKRFVDEATGDSLQGL